MNTQQIKESLTAQFGTDEALGVQFQLADGSFITLAQYDEMFSRLGRDGMPDCCSFFPDGFDAICCTHYAGQIYKAYPERTRIFGFANRDNPTSRVAREEIHPGGHDFAIVDGRYLVDPWIKLVANCSEQIVFDIEDPVDAALVADIYGPASCWRLMSEAMELYLPAHSTVEEPACTPS